MVRFGIALIFVAAFGLSACSGSGSQELTRPTYPAPATLVVNVNPVGTVAGDITAGAQLWRAKQCVACHGPTGAGGMGGALAATTLSFDQFLSKVRLAIPPKPAMNASDLSNADAYSIYLWVRALPSSGKPPEAAITPLALPSGQVPGIRVWSEKECAGCHGAFAQGSAQGSPLVGESNPFEQVRVVMRSTAAQIPAHSAENIPDDLLKRLLDWLARGANPASGC